MTTRRLIPTLAVVGVLASAGAAQAVIIDFEGVAAPGTQTTETNSTNTFNGFDVFVAHGHYQDSAFNPGNRPANGTDWLLHDHFPGGGSNQPVVITQNGGGVFSMLSIDASEWENAFVRPQTLTLTGHFDGGGQIVLDLLTDDVFGFQTFDLSGLGFTNLVQFDIFDSNATTGSCSGFSECGSLGYDNVVVSPGVVPEPGTVALLATGLGLLGLVRRRRS